MGMEVEMVKGRGPVFPQPLVEPADLDRCVLIRLSQINVSRALALSGRIAPACVFALG